MSSEWITIPLGKALTLQRGHDLPAQDRVAGDVPILGSSGITGYHNEPKASGPGVTVGRSGNAMGEINYSDKDFWPLNTALYVTDFKGNDPKFVYYLLKTIDFDQFNSGSAQKSLNRNAVYPFEIKIPKDFIEQRAISTALSLLEDKIEINHQINQTLEQMAQALFKSWFVDFEPVKAKIAARKRWQTLQPGNEPASAVCYAAEFDEPETGDLESYMNRAAMQAISGKTAAQIDALREKDPERYHELYEAAALFPSAMQASELGEIPDGWKPTAISQVAEIIKGKSYKSAELSPSKTALVTLKSFSRGGGYRLDGLKEYTGKYKKSQKVVSGDLVIAYTDVTQAADVIGKPAMVIGDNSYENLVISLDVGVVRPFDDSLKVYLYGLAKTENFQAHTGSHTTGTTVLHLSKNAVPDYKFALPLEALVMSYAKQVSPLFSSIDNSVQEGRNLSKLRDTLLPKLLSGEISTASRRGA